MLLDLYVPAEAKARFLEGLSCGSFELDDIQIAVEVAVCPSWVTDPGVKAKLTDELGAVHARIPITAVKIQFND